MTTVPGGLYIDANILIYAVEATGETGERAKSLLQAARDAGLMLVSSELMIAECLRGPLKTGHTARVAEYRNMFARPDDLRLLPITRAIIEASTLIAAKTGAKLFDAIHLATAVAAGCDAFVTNDKGIHHPEGLKLLRFWADFPRQ